MKDGTILLYGVPEKPNLSQKAIVFFTGMPYVHAAIYFEDGTYDSTMGGARWMRGLGSASEYWEPTQELTEFERGWMRTFLWWTARSPRPFRAFRWPYNYLKILVLMSVALFRGLWNRLGWMPFSHHLLGAVCSSYVDYAWTYAGRDIIPGEIEAMTVPGDLAGLGFFRRA